MCVCESVTPMPTPPLTSGPPLLHPLGTLVQPLPGRALGLSPTQGLSPTPAATRAVFLGDKGIRPPEAPLQTLSASLAPFPALLGANFTQQTHSHSSPPASNGFLIDETLWTPLGTHLGMTWKVGIHASGANP